MIGINVHGMAQNDREAWNGPDGGATEPAM
jgi:hypothetical protein